MRRIRKVGSSHFRQTFALSVAGFATILFALLLLFSKVENHVARPIPRGGLRHSADTSWRRDSSGYILSPDWDIHAPPQRRYYNWTLTEISGNPDGVWRPLLAINSQYPGPLVRVNEGDTLVIDVHNHLTNSTSLHWHGFLQNGTNFMDGTVGVTNCGIPPGASFRYEFKADGLRGTYWYHPHLSTQRVDGMFGPLVVHSPAENLGLEYATDRVVMVQDYYHDLSMALLPQYLAPDNENAEPVPDGALINGRNVVECAKVGAQRRCDTSSAALEALNLDGSVAHRLRFINVGAFAEFDISLDEHTVSLVEVDGTAVVPHPINRFRISVAQRYSVILPARQHQGSAFWLRATMNTHCFAETPDTLDAEVKAIVRYSPNAPIPSTTAWTSSSSSSSSLACKDLNLTEVRMSAGSPAPPPRADLLIPLRTNFEIGAYQLSRGFFNQTSWRPSTTPTLHTAISNLHSANKSFTLPQNQALTSAYDPTRQLVVKLTTAKTVDLLIDNYDDGAHPVHLHGYKFWVIASGTGYLDLDSEYPALDGATAVLRDTATVEGFGWVLIRFVADNPGMWALHCHIAWHVEAGMLMQFLVGAEVVGGWSVPRAIEEGCSHPELQRGLPLEDKDYYL